jgi:hypothetical protein
MKTTITQKSLSILIAISLLIQNFYMGVQPTYALTSGPTQPEFSTFTEAGTQDMVNEFTGDFGWNLPLLEVPGPNGGGYPISLSYNSGITPEQEASWVGLGFTLNPGAIIRNKRGFPDDLSDKTVTSYNKQPANWNASLGFTTDFSLRIFGIATESASALQSIGIDPDVSAGFNSVISFNSYKGLSSEFVAYAGFNTGFYSAQVNSDGEFTSNVNPGYLLQMAWRGAMSRLNFLTKRAYDKEFIVPNLMRYVKTPDPTKGKYKSFLLNNSSMPTINQEYEQSAYRLSYGIYGTISPLPIGIGAYLTGSINKQDYIESATPSFYGYLHSHEATNEDALMDYIVEKQDVYNLRDRYLSIPFNAADHFMVTGEGVGGTFRAHYNGIEYFRPNKASSTMDGFFEGETDMYEKGRHVTLGPCAGVTAVEGTGSYELTIEGGELDDESFSSSNDYYFRFMGDMGGYTDFGAADPTKASIDKNSNTWASLSGLNYSGEPGRSSYIGYHTIDQMNNTDGSGNYYHRFSYRSDLDDYYNGIGASESIGEYSIVNPNGQRYIYGLPVYNREEINFSYDVDDSGDPIVYSKNSSKKLGQSITSAYAGSYLLTEIHTSDYIDRTQNGPTDDDYGGYVKFNYEKVHGDGKTNWYHWRSPYTGLYNNRGQLSNPDDGMGSFTSGDKEIYYLESIETATHIAKFTTSHRADGLDANSDDEGSALTSESEKGSNALKKLDKITLYAKDADGEAGEVIKKVYFKYDYSLMDGIPNFDSDNMDEDEKVDSDADGSTDMGKLTLKTLFFDYGSHLNPFVSPYKFEYEYPTDLSLPNYVTTKYEDIMDDFAHCSNNNLDENPAYAQTLTDLWGNYQLNGNNRSEYMMTWLDQTVNETDFDPAAWNLKQITLPGGGKILVQYEMDRYMHVQDRKAMSMVNLSANTEYADDNAQGEGQDIYYPDLSSNLGISATDSLEIHTVRDYIQTICIDGTKGHKPQKLYFKFLYKLLSGSGASMTDFIDNEDNSCDHEYIEGYINVRDIGITKTGTTSAGKIKYALWLKLGNEDDEEDGADFPREICEDYYETNKGALFNNSDCDNTDGFPQSSADALDIAMALLDGAVKVSNKLFSEDASYCKKLDETYSYLRLPLPYEKLGGGIRVKRLLRFDPGMEDNNSDGANDDAMIYGHEYVYLDWEGLCSGVATNEPGNNAETNTLIGYLYKRDESTEDQIAKSGEDMSQFSGPLGEFILPAPFVGYSRVVSKNIHSGKTNDGFTVNEFYTTKDYPFDGPLIYHDENGDQLQQKGVESTSLTKNDDEKSPSIAFLSNKTELKLWAAQGYRFMLNQMNGQQKSIGKYMGEYDDINSDDDIIEMSSTTWNYFGPGEWIPTITGYNQTALMPLGQSTEVVCESKHVLDKYKRESITIDAGVMYWGALTIPYVIPLPYITTDITELYTHVTNHIIYCPAIVKSVTTYQDGVTKTFINRYFDPYNGTATVTTGSGLYDGLLFDTNDDQLLTDETAHEGSYNNRSFPASHFYNDLGPIASSEGLSFSISTRGANALLSSDGTSAWQYYLKLTSSDNAAYFTPGDLIAFKNSTGTVEIWNVQSISGQYLYMQPTSFYYADITGNNTLSSAVTILQSGKANHLNVSVGSVTTYGDFAFPLSSTEGYTLDNVLSASAATLEDEWLQDDFIRSANGVEEDPDNHILAGVEGKWRLQSEYIYKTDIDGIVNDAGSIDYEKQVFNTGSFDDFILFNWDDPDASEEGDWLKTNTFTDYSPDGNPLEEENILGISKVVKYGYQSMSLPYLVANNASFQDVLFSGFEYELDGCELSHDVAGCGSCFDEIAKDCSMNVYLSQTNAAAHSGNHSIQLNYVLSSSTTTTSSLNLGCYETVTAEYNIPDIVLFSSRILSSQVLEEGLSLKFWAKGMTGYAQLTETTGYNYTTGKGIRQETVTVDSKLSDNIYFEKLATAGEWSLYEAVVEPDNWASSYIDAGDEYALSITFSSTTSDEVCTKQYFSGKVQDTGNEVSSTIEGEIYVDDIRMAPLDAQLSCYVYDPENFRLLAQFDDAHFGSYFQYNKEGKLVRKIRETERGKKTLAETQYNVVGETGDYHE